MAAATGHEESRCLTNELIALANLHAGDFSAAIEHLSMVKDSPRKQESARAFVLADEISGDVELEQGHAAEALGTYEQVMARALAFAPHGDIVAELRRRRAECYLLLDRHAEADAEAQLGLKHCRELGDRYEEAATYRVAALAASACGRPDETRQLFEQGFALFEDIETPYEWGKLWVAFGDWLTSEAAGSYADSRLALEAYHAAHYRFEGMGAKARLAEANARIARLAATLDPAGVVRDESPAAPADRVTPRPPRPRSSRLRESERKTEWAVEQFGVITANGGMFELLDMTLKLARSRAPVLVLGESGTGKELIAHALHRHSGRRGEFMAINCAALPRDVIESELFGHVAGAFTGASRDKVGLLEVCEGGTVFLDEVSEMSPDLQSRMLRFLETGEIRRVGAVKVARMTTRVVAASNRDGGQLRSGQGFRPDLYYRLANAVIQLPPLRRRGARDIELLHDIQWLTEEYQHAVDALPPGVEPGPALVDVRWMIEELRVSFFAQTLGTAYPVSTKRVLRALDAAY